MTLYDHLFVILFIGVYPVYVFFNYRNIKKDLIDNKPGIRKFDYKVTSFWLWLFGLATTTIWILNNRPLKTLGLDLSSVWAISISLLFSVLIVLYFFSMLRTIRGNEEQLLSMRNKLNNTDAVEFLPKNVIEFKWFILLSISAGICEELLFRGYLFWYFEFFDNIVITLVVSSALFGLAHSYQGWKGIIKAAAMGLILAIIYALTDSLWIPIVLHIFGDIYGGILALLAFEEDKI